MPRDVRVSLQDILDAAALIHQFVADVTFEQYDLDRRTQSAVERQFGIIGEAVNAMLRERPDWRDRLTDSRRVIAFRNRLVHDYATISNAVVWGVIEGSLDLLVSEATSLLDELDAQS